MPEATDSKFLAAFKTAFADAKTFAFAHPVSAVVIVAVIAIAGHVL